MAREQPKPRRAWRTWLAVVAGLLVTASAGVAAYKVRAFALSDPQFTLSRDRRDALVVQGLRFASRSRVLRVFETDWGRSIFAVPLAERRRRLLGIDWVETASVSRLWPDRLAVRLTERLPVAFVNLPLAGATRMLLIDAHGVLLEPPLHARFSFPVLGGVTESQTEGERRARVQAMLRLLEDLGNSSKDISEVNAAELENLKVVAQLEGRAVELILGDGNYARRYQTFVSHFPEIRKRTPQAARFDLRLEDRIVGVGG